MHPQTPPEGIVSEFVEQTCRLYSDMDQDYQMAAAASGFICRGCEDNCCRTLFYHHTFSEFFTLRSGLTGLPPAHQKKILERAAAYRHALDSGRRAPGDSKAICPLNEAGRCALYAQRPMICRLHGVPHEFSPPGREQRVGPGCEDFYRQCGRVTRHRLARTPHYLKLAQLEAQLKQALCIHQKLKLTIADMLLQDPLGCRDGGI